MVHIWYIIAGILFLILFLLFAPLKISVTFQKTGDKRQLLLKIIAMFIPITLRINFDKGKKGDKEDDKKSGKNSEKKPIFSNAVEFKNNFDKYNVSYKRNKKEIFDILENIKDRIKIEKLDFAIYFGSDDPCSTGIITGALWAVLGNLAKFIRDYFGIKEVLFDVNPDFKNKKADVIFCSIVSFKIVYIINIVNDVRKIIKKEKCSYE